MTTILNKELRRQLTVDGADYVLSVDSDGLRLTGKGKRKALVQLRWRGLLSGDAAMAVALNASLQPRVATKTATHGAAKVGKTR